MRACVVFDSRFGNTERIARAIESGIKESGIQTVRIRTSDAAVDSLKQFDLICVGGPTEAFSATKPVKEFLNRLKSADLSGKNGFAFDTKLDWRISGSAAKFIEKELTNLGVRVVLPRESAIVSTTRSRGEITGATLKEGEESRFQGIGAQVGAALAAIVKPVGV